MNKQRRKFLQQGIIGAVAGIAAPLLSSATLPTADKKRVLRIAHITDVHIKNDPVAETGLRNLFREINSLVDAADFIINTGDTVYEANRKTDSYVASCWQSWNKINQLENKLPVFSVIGNHDNWYAPEGMVEKFRSSPDYRKNWVISQLNLPSRYYHFKQKNWHFIALDSIGDINYELDKRQLNWLRETLKSIKKSEPVCILSHVPILSVASLMYMMESRESPEEYKFPASEMHRDSLILKNLFFEHPNVRLALSGHTHYADSVKFQNVTYLCNGAASGNWWKGSLNNFAPAYALIDLFEDGSMESNLIEYDWRKDGL
ncbi:metallophosphoesterase family protein [Daejeonella oryzae]|uniref:metallophosphoesterase family protein n=1 Tax=Daejeonella oryzae TaxID=1122943 RepID=UPI000422DF23|nr:metallophosphoesterase [Daejeonella oryzae]